MKLVSIGVGKTGTAGEGTLPCLGVEDMLLKDTLEALSAGSGTETIRLCFLKLEDEIFFLSPLAALEPNRPGEGGIEGMLLSLSAEVTLVKPEAVEEVTSVESEPGIGDDAFRLFENVADGGVALKARLGNVC